jgi:D-sedoheptulose 7-phosphate isomerase
MSFTEYLQALQEILGRTMVSHYEQSYDDIEKAFVDYIGNLYEITQKGNRIFFVGNGGSAGICTHSANDYAKNGGFRCMSLHDGAVLTCLGNDFGFEHIFAKQLEFHAQQGDALIAISSSGRSEDILNAVRQADEIGMFVCTFSGFAPENPLRTMGTLNWYIDSSEYGFVELAHQILIHCALDRRDMLLEHWSE